MYRASSLLWFSPFFVCHNSNCHVGVYPKHHWVLFSLWITYWHKVDILAAEALALPCIAEAIYLSCLGFCCSNLCDGHFSAPPPITCVLSLKHQVMRCLLDAFWLWDISLMFLWPLWKSLAKSGLWNKKTSLLGCRLSKLQSKFYLSSLPGKSNIKGQERGLLV